MRIGVDTGGTFTDCVTVEDGQIKILKVFSGPDAAGAILEGIRRLVGEGLGLPRVPKRLPGPRAAARIEIVHGTTVGTNTLLERRGARVGLVTTAGFEDLIEIGRQARPRLYDLNVEREPPLIPRAFRWGVRERTAAGGKVLRHPTRSELQRLRALVKRSRVESLAVCFLFSFANPANERAVAHALQGLGFPLSVSHEILAEFREYERLSTVAINAYLAPRLSTYLQRLEHLVGQGLFGPPELPSLREHRIGAPLHPEPRGLPNQPRRGRVFVMQSSGGIMTAARAAREPVRTILSGPAGGVVAAHWLAQLIGNERVISFDMGGTSTDVCLIDGQPRTTTETTLGSLPLAVPVLDVHSVGAGGGSIARIDRGGSLRVGPVSAGASPGPICYGRGGTEPTVSDANLLLGRLDPDYFLGGAFRLDLGAAERGFEDFLLRQPRAHRWAQSIKTPLELAQGIVAVSNATLEKALRVISVERGHDPRDFLLISFGGAGGLHAADLARSLRLTRVVIPQNPGAFSALGILLSDIVKDVSQSVLLPVPDRRETSRRPELTRFFRNLERRFERLERAARVELRREQLPENRARIERRLDVRYVGQSYELSVPFNPALRAEFHREHEKAYGYAQPERPLEIVNLRLRLVVSTPKPPVRRRTRVATRSLSAALVKQKPVWFGGRFWPTPLYDRIRLESGTRLTGPAVVIEYSSTTVVPPDFVCQVDEYLNLVLFKRG